MGWLRGALVVVELSLAIILLSGAGLFLHTLLRLHQAPLAAEIENRLLLRIPLSGERYKSTEHRNVFLGQLLERVEALPGVLGAGINGGVHPLWSWDFPVEIPGSARSEQRPVNLHQVNTGYLKATGIALMNGRWLEKTDIDARRQVVVVNQTFLRRYFPDQNALGRTVKMWRLKMPPFTLTDDHFEIIGVTEDALHELQSGQARPEMYIPYSIMGFADMLVVHTKGDPMRMAPSVRRQVYELDRLQYVDDVRPLDSLMDRFVYSRGRFQVWIMGVFAVVGLALAVIGVYGLLAQVVAAQRREFGVRMAVGAGFGDIVKLILRRGTLLMLVGLAIGVGITLLILSRFGIELGVSDPYDPASISGACLVLFAAGLIACLVPAVRAGRTNPVSALRLE